MKRDGEKLLRVARDGTMRTKKRSQREMGRWVWFSYYEVR